MNVEDYTQHALTEDGVYRVFPVTWTLEPSTKSGSQSVAILTRFAIHQKWHGKEQGWSAEWPPGYYVDHRAYVVGKDGELSQKLVEAVGKAGLWNGDWNQLDGPPPSVFMLLDVTTEMYEGVPRSRGNWLNPNADEPQPRGSFAPTDTKLLANLRERFQQKSRAVAGGAPSGPLAGAGTPAPPVVPQPVPQPAPWPGPPVTPSAAVSQPPQVSQPAPAPAAMASPPQPPQQVAPPRQVTPPQMSPPRIEQPPEIADDDDPVDPGSTPF